MPIGNVFMHIAQVAVLIRCAVCVRLHNVLYCSQTCISLSQSDTIEQDKFTLKQFLAFYMHLTGRREIEKIFDEM